MKNNFELVSADKYIQNKMKSNSKFAKGVKEEEKKLEYAFTVMKLRESLNLTQEEFAKKVNKPQSTIARIESGEGNPTMKTVFEIGYAVGKQVNISYE